ncbi:hypothetical protein [Escherichia coli]
MYLVVLLTGVSSDVMLCSRGGLLCLPDQLHFVNTVLTANFPSSARHMSM